jgi:hypothetical protein
MLGTSCKTDSSDRQAPRYTVPAPICEIEFVWCGECSVMQLSFRRWRWLDAVFVLYLHATLDVLARRSPCILTASPRQEDLSDREVGRDRRIPEKTVDHDGG